MNSKEKLITVEDSDEDDISAWDELDDDILISEGNVRYKSAFSRDFSRI